LIIEEFPNWSKYNESNLGNAFAKFLSMIGDIEAFYQNKMINQLLLPTVTLRKYAIFVCKMLGYRLKSAIPSTVQQVQITITAKSQTFTIPAGYPIGTKPIDSDGNYIQFETDKDLVFPANVTTGIVSCTQGVTIYNELIGISNGKINQRYVLAKRKAIDGYYICYINENNVLKTWSEVETFAGEGSKDVFITEVDELDRSYIIFGDGINGRIPPQNSEIYCTYRVGGGASTNIGIGTITENKGNLGDILSITNLTAAEGGKDRETISEAKLNAPIFFKTAERAVTRADFKALCLRVTNVKRAEAIANANIVDVYIASADNNGIPTQTLKDNVLSYLNERKIITFIITVNNPYFPSVDITLNAIVKDNIRRTDADASIRAKLNEIFSINNKDFGQTETLGNIYKELLSLAELDTVEITKFTTSPIIYAKTQSAIPAHTFNTVTILTTNALVGEWKVTMTSATEFVVEFYNTITNSWINKGTGTIGSQFTSLGSEIQFTITSNGGTSAINDYWVFYTNKYIGNITEVQINEILKPGTYTINLSGGIV
jgi:hypothetical protein